MVDQRTLLDTLEKQLYNFIKDRYIDLPIDDVVDFGPDYQNRMTDLMYCVSYEQYKYVVRDDGIISVNEVEIRSSDIDIWTLDEILHQYGFTPRMIFEAQ